MNKTTFYKVSVVGNLWSGHKAGYSKNFTTPPDNIESVKKEFGDFESICDFQVQELTVENNWEGNKHTRIQTDEVITEFSDETSLDYFNCRLDKDRHNNHMIKLCNGYNTTNNMGELQWAGHVGWPKALRSYVCDLINGRKPNLVCCYASWQYDWFVMYHNPKKRI